MRLKLMAERAIPQSPRSAKRSAEIAHHLARLTQLSLKIRTRAHSDGVQLDKHEKDARKGVMKHTMEHPLEVASNLRAKMAENMATRKRPADGTVTGTATATVAKPGTASDRSASDRSRFTEAVPSRSEKTRQPLQNVANQKVANQLNLAPATTTILIPKKGSSTPKKGSSFSTPSKGDLTPSKGEWEMSGGGDGLGLKPSQRRQILKKEREEGEASFEYFVRAAKSRAEKEKEAAEEKEALEKAVSEKMAGGDMRDVSGDQHSIDDIFDLTPVKGSDYTSSP
jgi:hypothetical protein